MVRLAGIPTEGQWLMEISQEVAEEAEVYPGHQNVLSEFGIL